MMSLSGRVWGPAIGALVILGCADTRSARLNAPPQGHTDKPHEQQATFIHMADNAMLSDMSIADIHFVPNTAELNALGERRLDRYARMIELYGGTLHYDTELGDDDLIAQRMDHVREFLATTGLEKGQIKVVQGMPSSMGMTAKEAVTRYGEALEGDRNDAGGATP